MADLSLQGGTVDVVEEISGTTTFLLCRCRERLCALPLPSVVETMRPLPIEALPNAPAFVSGFSLVRGHPIPVVDLGGLLGAQTAPEPTRFVILRIAQKNMALSVEAVLDVRQLSPTLFRDLPPLLHEASADIIDAVGALDAQLLLVLKAGHFVPEPVWRLIEAREVA